MMAQKRAFNPSTQIVYCLLLDALDAATNPQDLNFPGSNLHQLQPKKNNRWAVKVSGNWRVTFTFEEEDVHDVDYEDYH